MAVFAFVVFGFLFMDNVVLVNEVHDGQAANSFTNQGWDAACDALGYERTAAGDCISVK